jgi:putative transcriptional regulator
MLKDAEIIIRLDEMLALRKMTLQELNDQIGTEMPNLSIFHSGKGRAIKLVTLMRLCQVLDCTPNDIIQFRKT